MVLYAAWNDSKHPPTTTNNKQETECVVHVRSPWSVEWRDPVVVSVIKTKVLTGRGATPAIVPYRTHLLLFSS